MSLSHVKELLKIQYRSKVSWQSVASLDSRFLRESSIDNREPVIENRELLIENRVKDRVWKRRFSHDWFVDNFTLSEQNKPQAATPVLRERLYASEREMSKLIREKCVLKYLLWYTFKCLLQMQKKIYSLMHVCLLDNLNSIGQNGSQATTRVLREWLFSSKRYKSEKCQLHWPVSYTHLTLPTKLEV